MIDAGLELRGRGITLADVAHAEIAMRDTAHQIVCEPPEKIYTPQSVVELQFNAPYTLAVALARGRPTLEDFTDAALNRTSLLGALDTIHTTVDPEFSEYKKRIPPARVTVRTTDGREESSRSPTRRATRPTA